MILLYFFKINIYPISIYKYYKNNYFYKYRARARKKTKKNKEKYLLKIFQSTTTSFSFLYYSFRYSLTLYSIFLKLLSSLDASDAFLFFLFLSSFLFPFSISHVTQLFFCYLFVTLQPLNYFFNLFIL